MAHGQSPRTRDLTDLVVKKHLVPEGKTGGDQVGHVLLVEPVPDGSNMLESKGRGNSRDSKLESTLGIPRASPLMFTSALEA